MRVVPKWPCLVWNSELIKERFAWNYWTLVDKSRAISPICSFLKNSMPMLYSAVKGLAHDLVNVLTMLVVVNMELLSVSWSMTLIRNVSPWHPRSEKLKLKGRNNTYFVSGNEWSWKRSRGRSSACEDTTLSDFVNKIAASRTICHSHSAEAIGWKDLVDDMQIGGRTYGISQRSYGETSEGRWKPH